MLVLLLHVFSIFYAFYVCLRMVIYLYITELCVYVIKWLDLHMHTAGFTHTHLKVLDLSLVPPNTDMYTS